MELISLEHFSKLCSSSKVLHNFPLDIPSSRSIDGRIILLGQYFNRNKTSLREIETLIRTLEVAHVLRDKPRTNPDNFFFEVLGVLIHCFESKLANKIINQTVTVDDMFSILGESAETFYKEENQSSKQYILYAISRICIDKDIITEEEFDTRQTRFMPMSSIIINSIQTLEMLMLER